MEQWNTRLGQPVRITESSIFYNGKSFCLRGGQEQRGLKLSQIIKEVSYVDWKKVNCYVYREFGSKNRQGGFASLNMDNKVVRQHENTSGKGACHVKILDLYLQKLPSKAWENDVFYLTPLQKKPEDPSKSWFTLTPVGKNRLNTLLKEMCVAAGLSDNYSNHSLRAYGATAMFQAGIPEKLIQERTGHRSIDTLRKYERTSESQLLDVSNVVVNNGPNSNATVPFVQHNSMPSSTCVSTSLMPSSTSKVDSSISLSGCTFNNCTISINVRETTTPCVDAVLHGLNAEDIFDD